MRARAARTGAREPPAEHRAARTGPPEPRAGRRASAQTPAMEVMEPRAHRAEGADRRVRPAQAAMARPARAPRSASIRLAAGAPRPNVRRFPTVVNVRRAGPLNPNVLRAPAARWPVAYHPRVRRRRRSAPICPRAAAGTRTASACRMTSVGGMAPAKSPTAWKSCADRRERSSLPGEREMRAALTRSRSDARSRSGSSRRTTGSNSRPAAAANNRARPAESCPRRPA